MCLLVLFSICFIFLLTNGYTKGSHIYCNGGIKCNLKEYNEKNKNIPIYQRKSSKSDSDGVLMGSILPTFVLCLMLQCAKLVFLVNDHKINYFCKFDILKIILLAVCIWGLSFALSFLLFSYDFPFLTTMIHYQFSYIIYITYLLYILGLVFYFLVFKVLIKV